MNGLIAYSHHSRPIIKMLFPVFLSVFLSTITFAQSESLTNNKEFKSIPEGAILKSRREKAPVYPANLTVDVGQFGPKDKIEFKLRGLMQLISDKRLDQYMLFQSKDEKEPIGISIGLPVNLRELLSPDVELQLNYKAESTVLGNSKDLLVKQDDKLIRSIQRYGNEPIVEKFNGISISQTSKEQSSIKPHSAYYYALPVGVTDGQGKTTYLWPGEFTQFVSVDKKKRVEIYVLVSDVAKPKGAAAHIMEGAAYGLQIAITQTP